jgi:hypothetical protein
MYVTFHGVKSKLIITVLSPVIGVSLCVSVCVNPLWYGICFVSSTEGIHPTLACRSRPVLYIGVKTISIAAEIARVYYTVLLLLGIWIERTNCLINVTNLRSSTDTALHNVMLHPVLRSSALGNDV